MGGALLQQVNRDTQKFAYKCSEATINGKAVDVYKDPVTDPGKRSKMGRLKLVQKYEGGAMSTISHNSPGTDLLEIVFENGQLMREQSLDEIRKIADSYLHAYPVSTQ